MTISCEHLEIDTKDICLLCLGPRIENRCLDNPSTVHSLQGLKHLLRYLKVSPKQLFNCSSEFLQSMDIREDIDLKINLCSKCSSVTEKFNKLHQDYELIQLQFSDCVQTLYQSISDGNECAERVRKYRDRMRPTKSSDLVNASIAANLRNETLKKCSLKLQSRTPKVRVVLSLQNPNLKKSKLPNAGVNHSSFISGETDDSDDNAYLELITGSSSENHSPFQSIIDAEKMTDNFQTLTEANSDTEVATKLKSVKTTRNCQKTSYFNSAKNKLKTKLQQSTAKAPVLSSPATNTNSITFRNCNYCDMKYSSDKMLNMHMTVVHPEHFISKFLPPNISSELCKTGIRTVWEEMFKVSSSQCQFCMSERGQMGNLKCHLITTHAEQFAETVLENIQSGRVIIGQQENTVNNPKCTCEHCGEVFSSKQSLRHHKSYAHPEHIVYKYYYPSQIPLESCKQAINVAIKQMKRGVKCGYKCKFCLKTLSTKRDTQIHVVSVHTKQIAAEVKQFISFVPEHLEGESGDFATSSSNTVVQNEYKTNEDIDDSTHLMPEEMDFEIGDEEFIKVENLSPVKVELDLDPLGMG